MRTISQRMAIAFALVWLTGLAVIAAPRDAKAGSGAAIDAAVDDTLGEFYWKVRGGKEMVARAAGVLVFPKIYKAGVWIGGEYGEGALRRRGRTVDYYNTISASFGFQLGAQARSVVIVFMTQDALNSFQGVDGWKVGVDGSVAIIDVGAGASLDSNQIAAPIVGYVFDGKGLMYNLTLEGTKISRITPR